jgi:hypothetical protein
MAARSPVVAMAWMYLGTAVEATESSKPSSPPRYSVTAALKEASSEHSLLPWGQVIEGRGRELSHHSYLLTSAYCEHQPHLAVDGGLVHEHGGVG